MNLDTPRDRLHPPQIAIRRFRLPCSTAATALRLDGTDNGPPGPRPDYAPGYYAACVIDPHGYRIEAHHDG